MTKTRCTWSGHDDLMIQYHDQEWGVAVHDDVLLFELLTLEGAQAGLSWKTVLHKRENYRKAFDHFDVKKIADYNQKDIDRLLADAGIIRNRLKILATIQNAKAFMAVQQEFGSFNHYIWQFSQGKTILNKVQSISDIASKTKLSDTISKDLKKRHFKFVGSTICYAFMQAIGMVDDHEMHCFRKKNIPANHH